MKQIALLMIASACMSTSQQNPDEYRLGVLDQIGISVARHPEYTGTFIIPEMGKINFPMIGEVSVLGLSIAELQADLTGRVSKRLNNPEVYITLLTPRPKKISVIGSVMQPNVFELRPGWRISEALAAAGGVSLPPERVICRLFRLGTEARAFDLGLILRNGDTEENVSLIEGDTVSVQAKKMIRVYVAGSVQQPGSFDIEEGSTALQAITKAGGASGVASLRRAYIFRGTAKVPVDMFAVLVEGKGDQDKQLLEGDTLTIPKSNSRVAVFGEVASPGWLDVPEDRDLLLSDALAIAGGVKKSGITSNIAIMRRGKTGLTRENADFRKFLKNGDPIGNPPIANDDVIIVSAGRRGDIERIFGGILTLGLVSLFK